MNPFLHIAIIDGLRDRPVLRNPVKPHPLKTASRPSHTIGFQRSAGLRRMIPEKRRMDVSAVLPSIRRSRLSISKTLEMHLKTPETHLKRLAQTMRNQ
jgi:hypothetical protein